MFNKDNMIKSNKYTPGVINQEIHEVVSSILGEYYIHNLNQRNMQKLKK